MFSPTPDAKIRHGSHRIASKRTQIIVPDRTPGVSGIGGPKTADRSSEGRTNILLVFGLYTNGINPRRSLGEVDGRPPPR